MVTAVSVVAKKTFYPQFCPDVGVSWYNAETFVVLTVCNSKKKDFKF